MRATWPPKKTNLILRERNKGGLRGYINANCIDCVYEETEPGSWLRQVDECDAEACCPLYPVRPKQKRRAASHG